jgi:rhodanese-related sulfurtransferase
MMLFSINAVSMATETSSRKKIPTLAVPVESVLRNYRKDRIFIVDVRPKNAYEAIKIPGSLNVPLHAVKTVPFLKTKPIVLVNDGYADLLLDRECRGLKQNGFSAAFLKGGLNAWRYKKGPLEGDLLEAGAFSAVSARIYHQEKETKNTIVVDISAAQSATSEIMIPHAIHLPAIGRLAKQPIKMVSAGDLTAAVSDLKKMPKDALLVTNRDGEGYGNVEKIMAAANLGPVFYLEGGLRAYRRFLKHLALSRQPMEKRIKTINECEPCSQTSEIGSIEKKKKNNKSFTETKE